MFIMILSKAIATKVISLTAIASKVILLKRFTQTDFPQTKVILPKTVTFKAIPSQDNSTSTNPLKRSSQSNFPHNDSPHSDSLHSDFSHSDSSHSNSPNTIPPKLIFPKAIHPQSIPRNSSFKATSLNKIPPKVISPNAIPPKAISQDDSPQARPLQSDSPHSDSPESGTLHSDFLQHDSPNGALAADRRSVSACAAYFPARYMFALQAAISFAIIYGLKVNLSVAIVAMVNATAVSGPGEEEAGEGECPAPEGVKHEDGPFAWDETTQGHILGSYFYGYLVAQIPGALLAESLSAKWVMFGAVVANVVGCVLTPPVCHNAHFGVFIALRIVQGLGAGVTFPAMHVMIAHWAPPSERSLISGVIYAGTALGTVGSTLMAGYLSASMGWEWVFYLMAILSVPWFLFWVWWISDSPAQARYITEKERHEITSALGDSVHGGASLPFPTRAVLKSLPFWAIMVAHFCSNCGWYMILTELPSFMKHVLHKNIKENAGMSAIPYFNMWVVSVVLGMVMDRLRNAGKITTGTARKVATAIASIIPGACLVGISFIKCDADAGTALIIVAVSAIGAMFVGFLSNHIDIAPNFAGMLVAITNTFATIPGILMPIIVGKLTEENQTLGQWSKAFYSIAVLYAIMFVFYTIFASGEEQPWNNPKEKDEEDK